jgi:hypothetical protein
MKIICVLELKTMKVWTVRSDYHAGHEYGYYDMGIFSTVESAKAAAVILLEWIIGKSKEPPKYEWEVDKEKEIATLIHKGVYSGEDTYIEIRGRVIDQLPKDEDDALQITYT